MSCSSFFFFCFVDGQVFRNRQETIDADSRFSTPRQSRQIDIQQPKPQRTEKKQQLQPCLFTQLSKCSPEWERLTTHLKNTKKHFSTWWVLPMQYSTTINNLKEKCALAAKTTCQLPKLLQEKFWIIENYKQRFETATLAFPELKKHLFVNVVENSPPKQMVIKKDNEEKSNKIAPNLKEDEQKKNWATETPSEQSTQRWIEILLKLFLKANFLNQINIFFEIIKKKFNDKKINDKDYYSFFFEKSILISKINYWT